MPRIFLLDGTALAYRAHFAMARSGLSTPEGQPSGATYGFALTLRKLLEDEKPDHIAVAFDPPGPTFRHKKYKEYKATREKIPDELVSQLPWLRDLVRAHGIAIFEVPGFEADDVIGTLARQAEARGYEVRIVTGDKDFMQLISPAIKLYNVFKQDAMVVIEDEQSVLDKFGTDPSRVIDVLAIMGDSSDNVPGVHGIGEKGASKLIQQFGSVANLLERLGEVKGKAREYIERDREMMILSRELVTISTDVPLAPGLEGVGPAAPDAKGLRAFFGRLGFQSLMKKVESSAPDEAALRDYRLVRSEAELLAMEAELLAAGRFAIDTETTSLFPLEAELVGVSFSCESMRAWYVPFNLDPPLLPGGRPELLERLRPFVEDPRFLRTGQNSKYDMLVFIGQGLSPAAPEFDTMVASYCIAGATRRHNLDDLALTYLDLKKIPTSELIGRGAKQITMKEVPIEKVAEYSCEDADVTWRLRQLLEKELDETANTALFRDLEMPLVPVLTAMEARGIKLDVGLIEIFGRELDLDIAAAEKAVHAAAGREFNLGSPKVLGEVLFEQLRIQDAAGVKRPKRTQTGWSTDAETLESNYGEVEIVKRLLDWREVTKLKNTYVDALPRFVNPRTGRVHCSFSQVTAATGRLASSDPNLQNIPVRTERGQRLRAAFVAREPDERGEWVLFTADYSQVELRIMAHFAGEDLMKAAFAEGRDIHASTASVVFDVDERLVTREMRSRAKAVNFGLLYGMGAARLASETGLSIVEAKRFMLRYFESFPKLRIWREALLEHARTVGYVETIFGRRRPMPELNSENGRLRAFAENMAVNTPIQGSAADIIKKAMIDLEVRLAKSDLSAQLLLQVHDELVLEVPRSELDRLRPMVVECMQDAAVLDVPLAVETGFGKNWLEAH
ncbi:MAG TPA: DNA polymerase I [Planctomycetota bacterium]|nr:DNA polymerase I [Planctomycetota bacterium]